MLFLRFMYD